APPAGEESGLPGAEHLGFLLPGMLAHPGADPTRITPAAAVFQSFLMAVIAGQPMGPADEGGGGEVGADSKPFKHADQPLRVFTLIGGYPGGGRGVDDGGRHARDLLERLLDGNE